MLPRVPHGSVVKCLTHNPGVLSSSRTGSSGFFDRSVLWQDASEPSLVLVKPRKNMNNVSCRHDMTEILLCMLPTDWLIDCMVFNAIFNSISVISRWPVHLSMFFWSSINQYSAQYTFLPFSSNLKLSSANSFSLEESKICLPVMG